MELWWQFSWKIHADNSKWNENVARINVKWSLRPNDTMKFKLYKLATLFPSCYSNVARVVVEKSLLPIYFHTSASIFIQNFVFTPFQLYSSTRITPTSISFFDFWKSSTKILILENTCRIHQFQVLGIVIRTGVIKVSCELNNESKNIKNEWKYDIIDIYSKNGIKSRSKSWDLETQV